MRPELARSGQEPETRIYIIDNSFPMRVQSRGISRFDLAKAFAYSDVWTANAQIDRVGVISAGTAPSIICPPTAQLPLVIDGLNKIRQTDGTCDLASAIQTAAREIVPGTRGRIVFVTDGIGTGANVATLERSLPAGASVRFVNTGVEGANNVGLLNLVVTKSTSVYSAYVVGYTTPGINIKSIFVEFYDKERLIGVSPVSGSNTRFGATLRSNAFDPGDTVMCKLQSSNDSIPSDDVLSTKVPVVRHMVVALAGAPSVFLKSSLSITPNSTVVLANTNDVFMRRTKADVTVLNNITDTRPLPQGRYLTFGCHITGLPLSSALPGRPAQIVFSPMPDILGLGQTLIGVNWRQSCGPTASQPGWALATGNEGALIGLTSGRAGTAISVEGNLGATDWVLAPSFPIFVERSLRFLNSVSHLGTTECATVGNPTFLGIPASSVPYRVVSPDGTSIPLHLTKSYGVAGATIIPELTGRYTVTASDGTPSYFYAALGVPPAQLTAESLPSIASTVNFRPHPITIYQFQPLIWIVSTLVLSVTLLEWYYQCKKHQTSGTIRALFKRRNKHNAKPI